MGISPVRYTKRSRGNAKALQWSSYEASGVCRVSHPPCCEAEGELSVHPIQLQPLTVPHGWDIQIPRRRDEVQGTSEAAVSSLLEVTASSTMTSNPNRISGECSLS
jgi:hypothetical protein